MRISFWSLGLAGLALVAAAFSPRPARAQGAPVLALRLEAADVGVLGGPLRAGLERDLGRPVVLEEPAGGTAPRATLTVRILGDAAELVYREGEVERRRRVELSSGAEARVEELVLIGANLVRDPAEALIAERALPEAPHDDATPARPTAGLTAPTAASTQAAASEPVASPGETSEAPEETPSENFALENPWHLGASLIVGAAARDGAVEGFVAWGLDVAHTVHPNVTIGVSRLTVGAGYSSVEGTLLDVTLTPFAELYAFPDERVQVYGRLGVALQGRTQTAYREGIFQVAPYVGGGVRFWLADWFTLGAEVGVHFVATDAFLLGALSMPQATLPGTVGLSAEFSFR